MNLLERLDEAYAKSQDPDKIASQLSTMGWIRLGDIDEAFYDLNYDLPVMIGYWLGDNFVPNHKNWSFKYWNQNFRNVLRVLSNYYIKPMTEYQCGDKPDQKARRGLSSNSRPRSDRSSPP